MPPDSRDLQHYKQGCQHSASAFTEDSSICSKDMLSHITMFYRSCEADTAKLKVSSVVNCCIKPG